MKNNLNFSIVMPMYNSISTIEKTLMSIINGNYRELELIIVDDGSTDDSLNYVRCILNEFDFHYKIVETLNNGQSMARDIGLSHVTTDFVIFLDSDDLLELNFFTNFDSLLKLDTNNESDIYFFDYNIYLNSDKYKNLQSNYSEFSITPGIDIVRHFANGKGPNFWTSNVIYRTSYLKEHGFKFFIVDRLSEHEVSAKYMFGEDIMFPLWACIFTKNVTYFPIVSANYVQHKFNSSLKFSISRIGAFYNVSFLAKILNDQKLIILDYSEINRKIILRSLNGLLYNFVVLKVLYYKKFKRNINTKELMNLVYENYPNVLNDFKSSFKSILSVTSFDKYFNYLLYAMFNLFPNITLKILGIYFSWKGYLKDLV